MTESEQKHFSFTGQPGGGSIKPIELHILPTVIPLAVKPPKQRSMRKSPRLAPTRSEELRLEEFEALICTAAKEAGRDNQLFCELLDQRGIPTPRDWRVGSWVEAHGKPALQSAIRGRKRRSSVQRSRSHERT
jgi:hypothetical protein